MTFDRALILLLTAIAFAAWLVLNAAPALSEDLELPHCDEPVVVRSAMEISLGQQAWLAENLPFIFKAEGVGAKELMVNEDGRWCSVEQRRGVTGWIPSYWWISWLDWRADVTFIYRVHRNWRGGISVTVPVGQ
jgi:hypothetical protein